MRKKTILLAVTMAAGFAVAPAMAEGEKSGTALKLASLSSEKSAVSALSASVKPNDKRAGSKTGKPVYKKRVKKRVRERLVAKVNLSSQRMNILVDGKLRHSWKISSGAKGFHTPTGSYKPYLIETMHYSKKYDNAPMPHSVFFRGGYAIHATGSVRRLGSPASHGCVRLSPGHARQFFKLVQRYKKAGTRIRVSGRTPASRGFKKRYARTTVRRASNDMGWGSYGSNSQNFVRYNTRRRASEVRRIQIRRRARPSRSRSQGRILYWKF